MFLYKQLIGVNKHTETHVDITQSDVRQPIARCLFLMRTPLLIPGGVALDKATEIACST